MGLIMDHAVYFHALLNLFGCIVIILIFNL